MPEAGDGWFSKMGNPAHPCVSTFTGPSKLGRPLTTQTLGSGATSTPLVDEDGTVYITEGLRPKANTVTIVRPDATKSMFPFENTSGTPAIMEGVMYIVNEKGVCVALNRRTDKVEWGAQYCGMCSSDSWSVAASKSMLIVQGSPNAPSDWDILPPSDHVYALSPKNGEVKWKFKTKAFLQNFSPSISGDVVVFTDMFGSLYCLKLADGFVVWQVAGEGSMISRSSGGACVVDGVVYQALNLKAKKAFNMTCGGKGAIRAYDLKTGKLKWEALYESEKLEAHAVPMVTPKGPGGKPAVVVGLGNIAGSPPPSPPAGDEWRGKVVALDVKDGKELWAFTPEPLRGACCTGSNSTTPWKAGPWSTAACGADGLLYICWHGGFLFILDSATGEKRSEWETGFSCHGTPAIGKGGTLAISGFGHSAIWIREHEDTGTQWQKRAELLRPYSETGTEHFSPCRVGLDTEKPYLYPYEAPMDLSKPTWCSWYRERQNGDVNNGGVFIDSQRNVWTGWNSGHLRCIRPDGVIRCDVTMPHWTSVFNAVLYEMSVIFLSMFGEVQSWNLETLELEWSTRCFTAFGASGLGPTIHEDSILACGRSSYSVDGEDVMACLSCKDGSLRWRYIFNGPSRSYNTFPTVAHLPNEGRKVAVAGTLAGGFYAIYLDTGELYWEVHLPDAFTTSSPTVGPGDGMMYVAHNSPDNTHGTMYAVDLKSKQHKWTYDCTRDWAPRQPVTQVPFVVPKDLTEDKVSDIVCIGLGSVVCGTEGHDRGFLEYLKGEIHGQLIGVNAETGKERWIFKAPPLRSCYPRGCSQGDTSPPDSWGGQIVSSRGIIYAYWEGGQMFAINGTTGVEISRYEIGSFANGAPAIAPGMLVVPAFDRIVCWRDEELEDKWLAENSSDKRAGSWKPLRATEAEEEKGPAPPRGPMVMDLGLPFPTVGGGVPAQGGGGTQASKGPAKKAAPKEKDDSGEGNIWVVVGGGSAGGIVVRKGEGLKSAELPRLATGARIKEKERAGDRLHYEKLTGDGPDFGWVSLAFKGTPLIQKE